MKKKIILPEQSLTFSDYFKLNVYVEDVAEYFGYDFAREAMRLPRKENGELDITDLTKQLEKTALRVGLTSEIALREFFIAPVLVKLLDFTDVEILPEYWLEVNHQLKGTFDYLLENNTNFVVIEAKNGELKRGFTQLAVELIALDKADESEQQIIYGAISIGEAWRFGKLVRQEKRIYEDINLFRVPADLPELLRILIGILE
jgi:hypothetical protein